MCGMPTVSIRVTGHVQGVGFRAFVADLAGHLEVGGEVWNTRDGAVELWASHSNREVLDDLERRLHGGPGRVLAVQVMPGPERPVEKYFRIGPTR